MQYAVDKTVFTNIQSYVPFPTMNGGCLKLIKQCDKGSIPRLSLFDCCPKGGNGKAIDLQLSLRFLIQHNIACVDHLRLCYIYMDGPFRLPEGVSQANHAPIADFRPKPVHFAKKMAYQDVRGQA